MRLGKVLESGWVRLGLVAWCAWVLFLWVGADLSLAKLGATLRGDPSFYRDDVRGFAVQAFLLPALLGLVAGWIWRGFRGRQAGLERPPA